MPEHINDVRKVVTLSEKEFAIVRHNRKISHIVSVICAGSNRLDSLE